MTAKVYTIASGKGGTGKSTVALNLGTAIAGLAKRTLLIDADIAMANIGPMLGMESSKVTLHDLLKGSAKPEEAIYEGPNSLKVLPSGISYNGFRNVDPSCLKTIVWDLKEYYDIILVDAPAGIGKDGIMALKVADEVILVVNNDISSFIDSMKTRSLVQMLNKQITGIVVNRVEDTCDPAVDESVKKAFGSDVLIKVPSSKYVNMSLSVRSPVVVKYPDSGVALSFKKLAALLTGLELPPEELPAVALKKKGFFSKIKNVFK